MFFFKTNTNFFSFLTNILPISIFQGSTLTHGTSPLGFLKGLTYQSSNYNNAKENDHMELLRNRLEQLKVLGPAPLLKAVRGL